MLLDNDELVALTAELLDVIDRPGQPSSAEVDSAWTTEIGRRLNLVASGATAGVPWEQVDERLQAVISTE